jgi:hypothetical protein
MTDGMKISSKEDSLDMFSCLAMIAATWLETPRASMIAALPISWRFFFKALFLSFDGGDAFFVTGETSSANFVGGGNRS